MKKMHGSDWLIGIVMVKEHSPQWQYDIQEKEIVRDRTYGAKIKVKIVPEQISKEKRKSCNTEI